jgi:hypothetical protein
VAHASTSKPNTRWSNRAQGQGLGARVSTSTRKSGGGGFETMADLQPDREAVPFYRLEVEHRSVRVEVPRIRNLLVVVVGAGKDVLHDLPGANRSSHAGYSQIRLAPRMCQRA